MRETRTLGQHIRERNGLLRTHANVIEMHALEILHLTDVAAKEGDEAVVMTAKVTVVAEVDEAKIGQLLQRREERFEGLAVEVAVRQAQTPTGQLGNFRAQRFGHDAELASEVVAAEIERLADVRAEVVDDVFEAIVVEVVAGESETADAADYAPIDNLADLSCVEPAL